MIKTEIRFKNATLMNALEKSKYNSLAELSRVSEIPVHTLYAIASLNHTNISTENQIKLAEMLNCDVYDLFEQYEEIIEQSKDYPKKITKDIPIDSILSLSSKEVIQLESDFNTDDIDNQESLEKDMAFQLNKLKDRERVILEMHFGLNGYHPKSMEEICLKFGLTKERTRQIKEKALRRLRHRSISRRLGSYVRDKDRGCDPSKENYSTKYSRELTKEKTEIFGKDYLDTLNKGER